MMQIVIDIDEETYKDIKRGKIYSSYRDVPQESVLAIANGTPLPKGHGRLIDADALKKRLKEDMCIADRLCDYFQSEKIDTAENYVEDTETIIEADKEGAE